MKLTQEHIERLVKSEQYHRFDDTTVTVCCLTLENGYGVVGESACVDPTMFNEEIGKIEARKSAIDKVWMLEGYMAKDNLYFAE